MLYPEKLQDAKTMDDEELKRRFDEISLRRKDSRYAELFVEAVDYGRTHEEIARVIGRARRWVSYHITFGEWLKWFGTMVPNHEFRPYDVPERRFREFWSSHIEVSGDINERRSRTLASLIEWQRNRKDWAQYQGLYDAIHEQRLDDGRKHRVEAIAEKTGYPEKMVRAFLENRQASSHFPIEATRPNKANKSAFIICARSKDKRIDRAKVRSRLNPYLEELNQLSKLHPIKISPPRLAIMAHEIEEILKSI